MVQLVTNGLLHRQFQFAEPLFQRLEPGSLDGLAQIEEFIGAGDKGEDPLAFVDVVVGDAFENLADVLFAGVFVALFGNKLDEL